MDYIIGIDLGTTATKAAIFRKTGACVAASSRSYPLYRDVQGKAEEDFEEIFAAMLETIREVTSSLQENDFVSAVSFSCQMHSLIAFDKEWQPLTPVMTWADTRAEECIDSLKSAGLAMKLYEKTGTPVHPMSPLAKLLWLNNEKNDIFTKAAHYLDLKGAIFQRIFQSNRIDLSIATGTGLFNNKKMSWDSEILDLLSLSEQQLPQVVSPYTMEKGLSGILSEKMGLSPDTIFVYGAADGPMSNLGVGAIRDGEMALTVGTSGALRLISSEAQLDKKGRTFSYALDEEHWVNGGAVNSGGDVFRWLRDNIFRAELSFDEMTRLAAKAEPGSAGLIFHPYLGGERAPLWNAAAKASFFGLNYNHEIKHMSRAVLEGICFNLRMLADTIKEVSGEIITIKATGGLTRSELWLQILSDILEMPITVQKNHEAGCFAAMIMAQKALGMTQSIEETAREATEKIYNPNPDNFKYYRALYPIFKDLTHKFEESYKEISGYQQTFL